VTFGEGVDRRLDRPPAVELPSVTPRLPRAFFARPAVEVARDLIGRVLHVRDGAGVLVGTIVETEAYGGETDLAAHASFRRNGNVRVVWGTPGLVYMYTAYGLHAMLNLVTDGEGQAGAVLIRALEPVAGIETMRVRRPGIPDARLCAGPGSLCRALGISLADQEMDTVTSDRLWLTAGEAPRDPRAGVRIGITRAVERPWRFFDAASRSVSAHRRGEPFPGGGV